MRKKEGNKEVAILDSAIKVFAEFGYHKSKIYKIAELANVATGSVYVYYEDKEAILRKIFDQLWDRLYLQLKSVHENEHLTSIEKVDALIDILFDIFLENSALALVFVNEQFQLIQKAPEKFTDSYNKFLDLGEHIVQDGIDTKLFNPKIDVKIIRSFIFGGLRHLLHQWAHEPALYPLHSIRQNVKFIIKNGLLK